MIKGKVFNSFFIFAALAFNFEFVFGDINTIEHHSFNILFAAIIFNIISTILQIGENNEMGNMITASSILSLFQLVIAATVWSYTEHYNGGVDSNNIAMIVSISAGALLSNALSVIMLIIETSKSKR